MQQYTCVEFSVTDKKQDAIPGFEGDSRLLWSFTTYSSRDLAILSCLNGLKKLLVFWDSDFTLFVSTCCKSILNLDHDFTINHQLLVKLATFIIDDFNAASLLVADFRDWDAFRMLLKRHDNNLKLIRSIQGNDVSTETHPDEVATETVIEKHVIEQPLIEKHVTEQPLIERHVIEKKSKSSLKQSHDSMPKKLQWDISVSLNETRKDSPNETLESPILKLDLKETSHVDVKSLIKRFEGKEKDVIEIFSIESPTFKRIIDKELIHSVSIDSFKSGLDTIVEEEIQDEIVKCESIDKDFSVLFDGIIVKKRKRASKFRIKSSKRELKKPENKKIPSFWFQI